MSFIPFSHKSVSNNRVCYVWQNDWSIELGKLCWVNIPSNNPSQDFDLFPDDTTPVSESAPEQCFTAKWAIASLFNAAKARGITLESNADLLAIARR